jgi:hypothetical protein
MHWGYRELCMPDSLALLQPNVELAFWLIDQLLYLEQPHIFSVTVFTRLCNCLRSANLPLKETVFKILTRVFVKWVTVLQQNKAAFGSPGASSSGSDETSALEVPSARLAVVRDVLTRHLSMSRILATVHRRIAFEQRQERLFFSAYVRSAVDFIIVMSKLQEALTELAGGGEEPALPASEPSPRSEAPGADDASPPPPLEPPRVSQTSDTSLLVQWQEGPSSSASSSSIFELEVSDRGLRRGGVKAGRGERDALDEACFRSIYRGPAMQFRMEGVCGSRTYNFRVRSTSSSGLGEQQPEPAAPSRWSEYTTIQTKAVAPFSFDRVNAGPSVFVSRDGMSTSFASNETWSTVLGTTAFLCGKNVWEVRINKSPTAYLFIGVARRQACLSSFLGGDEYGWGYIGDRALYNRRTKVKA